MEHGHSEPATIPTLSAWGHRSDAALNDIVKYAETLNRGTLCVTFEDELGRFRIWASNLGALQPAESIKSLDRRLKDAPLMRKSIVSGLERLEGSAKRALAILNKTSPNRSISGSDENPTTELDELLLSIRSAINHLFSLSMLIRRQRPTGRLPDFEEIALESSPDISYLTDKFPKVKSSLWLARRLGNHITRQRRVIQYRQHHRESLAKRDVKGSDPTDAATIVATTFQEESNPSGTNQTPQDADSSRMSILTSATSFLSLEDGTTTARSIPDLSDMVLDMVQLDYGEPFECPYCRTIQNVMNRYEWKRHVFTDLQPYVCTFKDCVIGNKSFSTRAEWFQHESTAHRLQWCCNWCGQADTIFDNAEGLKKHLNNTHSGMVTEAQMEMVLETCERPTKSFSSDSCALCADWEPPSKNENAKAFSRHLARHLQQLALEALPLAIAGLEIMDTHGLPDEELSLTNDSGNKEVMENQSDDMPSAKGLDKVGQSALDIAARMGNEAVVEALVDMRADTSELPVTESRRDQTEKSVLEQIKGKAPVTQEAAESSQTEESIRASENLVAEATGNRMGWSEPIDEEEAVMARIEKELDAAVAHEAAKKAAEELKKRLEEDPEARTQYEELMENEEKTSIRIRDAVGRKLIFPFDLCSTWQGMEDIIKKVFMQDDELGRHVLMGQYDLIGPDGEVILPTAWGKVIQPGMSITMNMWPMDNYPRPPAPASYKSVGPSRKKKHVRRGSEDSGPGMVEYLFGKERSKKVGLSSSADHQSQD